MKKNKRIDDGEEEEVDFAELIEGNEDVLDIDKYRLDREWVNQPKIFFRFAKILAKARQRLDEEKSMLDVIDAEVERDVRANPEDYDLISKDNKKPTEPAIKMAVAESKKHDRQVRKVSEAKYAVDIAQGFLTALDHKKKALENLVDLQGQSYYATPQTSGENREAMEEAVKKGVRSRGRKRKHDDDNDD